MDKADHKGEHKDEHKGGWGRHPHGSTVCVDWCEPREVYPRAIVGEPAPQFQGTCYFQGGFKDIKLSDYKGKYVCLFFYPLDFTFVCPTEILSFSEANGEFEKNGCVLIGASIDSHFSHYQYCKLPRNQGGLGEVNIPLLADPTKIISRIYGCLITKGPDAGVANRATFIIDDKGNLRHASYNDLPVGRNVDEVLRLVQAFQYSDKHGEVCPAKWKPGAKTMKTDVNAPETKKYWEEEHAKIHQ